MPTYHCNICETEPDAQKSHHTKHIKTKKHKDAKRILELELGKMTDEERKENHGKTDVAVIVASMETVVGENTESIADAEKTTPMKKATKQETQKKRDEATKGEPVKILNKKRKSIG